MFNLETKKMQHDHHHALRYQYYAIYIESRNEVHMFDAPHFIYKLEQGGIDGLKRIAALDIESNAPCVGDKVIYIESQQKLMQFGGFKPNRDRIFEYNLLDQSTGWTMHDELRMAHKTNEKSRHFDVILGFEGIIFVFYFEKECNFEIWCHHLLSNKSYKSKYKVPEFMGNVKVNKYVVKGSKSE